MSDLIKEFLVRNKENIKNNDFKSVLADLMTHKWSLAVGERKTIINIFNSLGIDLLDYCGLNIGDKIRYIHDSSLYLDYDEFFEINNISDLRKNYIHYYPSSVKDLKVLYVGWHHLYLDIVVVLEGIDQDNDVVVLLASYDGIDKV